MLVWPQVTALGAHALIRHCIAPLCVGEAILLMYSIHHVIKFVSVQLVQILTTLCLVKCPGDQRVSSSTPVFYTI